MSIKHFEHPDIVAPSIVVESLSGNVKMELDPCRDLCSKESCEGCPHFQPESIDA